MSSIRRRGKTVQINVDAWVDVDVDEVLEDIDTADLEAELDSRRGIRSSSTSPIGGPAITINLISWDAETLIEAVKANDAYRVLDILKERLK